MITIAVANQKGGVGKTTISFNLAYILAAKRGIQVLAVDNDAQAHLTGSFMNDRTNPKTFITNAYKGAPLTPQKINKNIHLIGANESLAHLTDGDIDILYRLRDSLRKFNTCDSKYKFDYAIIDCLPSSSFVQMAALAAADFVLVPVKPANYDFKGMASFMVQIEKIRHRLNPNLKILGMVINQVDGRRPRMEREMEEVLREKYGDRVLSSKINKRVNISESPAFRQPITEYDPESQSAQEFKTLGKEIIKRIKEAKNG